MQKKNKKADMNVEKVALVAISVVIIIIILFLGVKIAKKMMSAGEVEGCRLSVLYAGNVRIATEESVVGLFSPPQVELECPRSTVILSDKEVTVDGDEKRIKTEEGYVESFEELTADIVNAVAADQLRECWRKMGEGQIFPFTQSYWFSVLEKNQNVCIVCSVISFETTSTLTYSELYDYLQKNTFVSETEKQTYFDYLSHMQKGNDWALNAGVWELQLSPYQINSLELKESFQFDTAKSYAVYFKAHGRLDKNKGLYPSWYQISIVPNEELDSVCPALYS